MVQDYQKGTREYESGSKKETWTVMTYVERRAVSSRVDVRDHEEMMGEKRWLEYAQTPQGGLLSEDGIRKRWIDNCSQCKECT